MNTQGIGMIAGGVVGFLCFLLFLKRKKRTASKPSSAAASEEVRAAAWEEKHRRTRITLEDNLIRVFSPDGRSDSLHLDSLRSVSLLTYVYSGKPLHQLELRARRSISVPRLAQGFDQLEVLIRSLPGYDEHAFQKGLRDTTRKRRVVFRHTLPVNAQLQSGHATAELSQALRTGFRLADGDERVSLNETIEELGKKHSTTVSADEFGNGQVHTGPVVVGDLHLSDLSVSLNSGLANRPLRSMRSEVVLEPNDQTYWKLKKYFSSCLGEGKGWERSDSLHWSWSSDGLLFEINYWYDSDITVESEYCSLNIGNQRSYPEYLVDACSEQIDLREVQALILPLDMQAPTRDFRSCSWVKRTPAAILSLLDRSGSFIVWNDSKNRRIGFALRDEALIVPYDECGTIRILNALPAKGGGYSQLRVTEQCTESDRWSGHVAGSAASGELPRWKEALERTIGRPVERVADFHDD